MCWYSPMPTADISPGAENGLLTVSGSVLTEKAIVSGGETLLPLRAVAETLDLKVFWDAKTGANVALADGTKLLSVDPGHGTLVCGDGSELSAASIMQNGHHLRLRLRFDFPAQSLCGLLT